MHYYFLVAFIEHVTGLFFFFFERASLIFIDQMVVNNNKILYRGLNAQSLINPNLFLNSLQSSEA